MKISFDKDEILSAIDRVAKKTMTMDLTWDWPCGVAYYGLAEAYKATGKTEYMILSRKNSIRSEAWMLTRSLSILV